MPVDYTQTEDYNCPECPWSLHVEKTVWETFPDHQIILDYIQEQITGHIKTHGVEKQRLHPLNKDISIYKNTPYVYYSGDSHDS